MAPLIAMALPGLIRAGIAAIGGAITATSPTAQDTIAGVGSMPTDDAQFWGGLAATVVAAVWSYYSKKRAAKAPVEDRIIQ